MATCLKERLDLSFHAHYAIACFNSLLNGDILDLTDSRASGYIIITNEDARERERERTNVLYIKFVSTYIYICTHTLVDVRMPLHIRKTARTWPRTNPDRSMQSVSSRLITPAQGGR